MRTIADGDCKQWVENDCATIAPPPMASCASYLPACTSDHCAMRYSREVLPTE
jgi:hypothetical protein